MGNKKIQQKFLRPICIQFSSTVHNDMVMSICSFWSENKPGHSSVCQINCRDKQEKRKSSFRDFNKHTMRERSTKMKGNQLVFTESGNIYRDQVGPIHEPAADEVISNESVNIIKGNNIEKKTKIALLRTPPSQTHTNTWGSHVYLLKSSDDINHITHEGWEENGELLQKR